MASAGAAFLLAITMVLFSSVAMATDHVVGDEKGWTVDFDYAQWAKDKVFRVGDNLVFNYDSTKHNVFKVNGTLFQSCTFPDANAALSSGKDVIPLANTGMKWYICGKANHCADRGMKLVIEVRADGPAPAPSAAPRSVSALLMPAVVAVAAIFI